MLTGHFQTALYAFFALAIFLAADFVIDRGSCVARAGRCWVAAVAAAALPAVMVLPGLELTGESMRAGADYSRDAGAALVPGALATLVSPNHYGALDPGPVHGAAGHHAVLSLHGYPDAAPGGGGTGRGRASAGTALALIVAGAWYASVRRAGSIR